MPQRYPSRTALSGGRRKLGRHHATDARRKAQIDAFPPYILYVVATTSIPFFSPICLLRDKLSAASTSGPTAPLIPTTVLPLYAVASGSVHVAMDVPTACAPIRVGGKAASTTKAALRASLFRSLPAEIVP